MSAPTKVKPCILVVDDEPQIRRLVQLTLESAGFAVQLANTGEEGLIRAGMDHPNLVVLDLGLPDMDGMEVLKRLRTWAQFPILILSVRDSEQDIIAALDGGADDYLTKPFRSGELLARVRTALRHQPSGSDDTAPFTAGSISIDLGARVVKKNNDVVKLTSIEFSLLALFVRNAGRVLTHRYILEQVWGHAYTEETQYSRVYVAALRKKLEDDPANPKLILTESGIGYRLNRGSS